MSEDSDSEVIEITSRDEGEGKRKGPENARSKKRRRRQHQQPALHTHRKNMFKRISELKHLMEDESKLKYRLVPRKGDNPFRDLRGLVKNPERLNEELERDEEREADSRPLLHGIINGQETDLRQFLDNLPCFSSCAVDPCDYIYTVGGTVTDGTERKDLTNAYTDKVRTASQIAKMLNTQIPKHRLRIVFEGLQHMPDWDMGYLDHLISNLVHRDGLNASKEQNLYTHVTRIVSDFISMAKYGDVFVDNNMKTMFDPVKSVVNGPGGGASLVLNHTYKSQVKPCNTLQHVLKVLPMISEQAAKQIALRYDSMEALIDAYRACANDDQRADMLKDIPLWKQKLGPKKSEMVFVHLCPGSRVIKYKKPRPQEMRSKTNKDKATKDHDKRKNNKAQKDHATKKQKRSDSDAMSPRPANKKPLHGKGPTGLPDKKMYGVEIAQTGFHGKRKGPEPNVIEAKSEPDSKGKWKRLRKAIVVDDEPEATELEIVRPEEIQLETKHIGNMDEMD